MLLIRNGYFASDCFYAIRVSLTIGSVAPFPLSPRHGQEHPKHIAGWHSEPARFRPGLRCVVPQRVLPVVHPMGCAVARGHRTSRCRHVPPRERGRRSHPDSGPLREVLCVTQLEPACTRHRNIAKALLGARRASRLPGYPTTQSPMTRVPQGRQNRWSYCLKLAR